MNRRDSASSCSVRRSRRPQARLETSCTRTGRPRGRLQQVWSRRTAGEGLGHTARMYVCEESDSGIVPRNHSNKDGTSSAESEEGRLRLKENTLSPDTYPTQSGTARVPWVGECADKRQVWPVIHLREEPDALPRNSRALNRFVTQPWVRWGQVRSPVVWLAV